MTRLLSDPLADESVWRRRLLSDPVWFGVTGSCHGVTELCVRAGSVGTECGTADPRRHSADCLREGGGRFTDGLTFESQGVTSIDRCWGGGGRRCPCG